MIAPKETTVTDIDGKEHTFIIHKVPATVGREIVATYPVSALPKLGDYAVNEAVMLKMMSYVCAIPATGDPLALTTRALIDNHCADWQVLAKLEVAMLEYNTSFFGNGKVSQRLNDFAEKLPQLIIKTLTGLSAQLSEKEKPRSTS